LSTVQTPLRWPDGWPRTDASRRSDGAQFKEGSRLYGERIKRVSLDTARKKLFDELARLGARDAVLTMSSGDQKEPGVALYFTINGRQMAMACDRFDNRAPNTRSLGLAIEAMRQLERHGGGAMVERAFAGFAALPPPPTCWQVLGLAPGASEAAIRAAFKDKASQSGAGGNVDMGQLVKARDEALGKAAA
jgi:hypothetical protein